jgi:hypothetical protein
MTANTAFYPVRTVDRAAPRPEILQRSTNTLIGKLEICFWKEICEGFTAINEAALPDVIGFKNNYISI